MADLLDATDERGMTISPVLPDGCKNFLIDIDGTICEDIPNEEPERMACLLYTSDAADEL